MFVSILIPCYNAEPWIAKAIESALAQTWASKEVIVVDDGSTDGSLDEIQKFDGQIRWETRPNHGGNRARNRLTELAQGEWLQYLDADDYLLPEKVANQVEFIESNPNADVVFGPLLLNTQRTAKFIEIFTRFMSLTMTPGFCWRVGIYHRQVLRSSAQQRFVKLVGGLRTSCVARNMNSISDFSRPERAFNIATRMGVSIANGLIVVFQQKTSHDCINSD